METASEEPNKTKVVDGILNLLVTPNFKKQLMPTNKDLLILQQGLKNVSELCGDNVRFSYAIAKNDKLIATEIESLNKSIQATPEFQKYDEARIELVKKFSKKNAEGEAEIVNNQFVIEDLKLWEKEFKKFNKDYTEILAKREEQVAQYNKLLEEKTEIKLHMINENDLPRTITPQQLASILTIVE